jgi:iron(III) transport system substrate-binding protein
MKSVYRTMVGVVQGGVLSGVLLCLSCPTGVAVSAERGPQDEIGELYRSARNEGAVSIWSLNVEEMQWIPKAFNKAYPGIKVEIVTDLNIVSRVVTEARARRYAADVIWNSEASVQPLIERELLVRGGWEQFGVRKENVGADGHMLITSSAAYAVAYRKDRVSPTDVPKTWNDLADPKYRGKLAAGPILFARLTAALAAFEGEKPLLDYARTNDLLQQTITSGERPYVVAVTSHLAEGWKARGAPIEVVLPEPIFVLQFGAVVANHAPHPNAAKLLALWLESPQGRKELEAALLAVDLRPSSNHPKAIELRKTQKRMYVDNKEAMDARNRLIPTMDRIMAGLE